MTTEAAIYQTAAQLKQHNPDLKVAFYWSATQAGIECYANNHIPDVEDISSSTVRHRLCGPLDWARLGHRFLLRCRAINIFSRSKIYNFRIDYQKRIGELTEFGCLRCREHCPFEQYRRAGRTVAFRIKRMLRDIVRC